MSIVAGFDVVSGRMTRVNIGAILAAPDEIAGLIGLGDADGAAASIADLGSKLREREGEVQRQREGKPTPKKKPPRSGGELVPGPDGRTEGKKPKNKPRGTTEPLPGRYPPKVKFTNEYDQKPLKSRIRPPKEPGETPGLDGSARKLGFEDYDAYLNSEHWTWVKAAYALAWKDCKCIGCGKPRYQLHHVTYERIGREKFKDLIPVCGECHQSIHLFHRTTGTPLRDFAPALREIHKWSGPRTEKALAKYRSLPDRVI